MKKITLLLMVILCGWHINAQVSSYSFSAGTGGTLDPMTSSTQLVASESDDGVSAVSGIGFTFNYAGTDYTDFSVNANGIVRLGATAATSDWTNNTGNVALNTPAIMAYWDDLATGSLAGGGKVHSVLVGAAPNRKLIIEWFVTIPRNTSGAANAKFQCVLNETTNVIEFVYGTGMVTNIDNSGATIGLATSATLFNTVDASTNTVSQAVFKTDNTGPIANGTIYTWTPPTCAGSTGLTVNTLLVDGATVTWTPPSSVPSNGYEYVITDTQATPTGAGTATTTNTATATGLTANTVYYVYVRSNCGSSFGSWVVVGTFTTACSAFGDFTENFESTTTGELTNCWSSIVNSTSIYPYVKVYYNWNTQSNAVELYNSDDANAEIFLVTPSLTALPSGTHRLKFKVSGGTDYPLFVGTMSDPTNPTSFNAIQQILTTSSPVEYVINFDTSTTDTYIAFQHGLGDVYRSIYIDDVVWQPIPSCIEPTQLNASNITINSAELSWTEMSTATLWNIEYGPAGFTQGSGTVVSGVTNSYVLNGLTDNTEYDYYVQADCGSTAGVSYWVGPYTFTTSCNPFGDFTEDFESTASGEVPNCWYSFTSSTSQYTNVGVVTWNGYNSSQSVELYNSDDANAELYLITPNLTDLPSGNHRLKFRLQGGTGYSLFVGTMTDPTDNSTFVEVEPLQAPNGWNEYIVDFSSVTTTGYIAFKHGGGGSYRSLYIDNVTWEPVPATAPGCALNLVATPDAACGNYATSIDWDATVGADGYYLTMGTTTGGTDILNNEDLGNITSYSYTGDFNTTYYYTLVPYNSFGLATGCTEQSFTTFATGCYCVSNPINVDNSGITNVQLGTTDFPNAPVTYADYTATAVTLQQGLNTNVQVSFATGYTYNTYIWIDFNDNLNFETSELLYSGESLSTNPTLLNASFLMPAAATVGTHRMRLAAADYMPTADPCYNDYYGVTLDFSVNIVVPSCTPASAQATVSPDCANNQYFVDVNVTDLGSGTPSISDGTTTTPITATGVVQVGPFTNGSSVTLTVLHGTDSTCDLPLGTFTYACPPANDDLCNAIALTLNATVTGNDYSLSAATGQTSEPVPSCFSGGINGSVWFSFIAPASGSVDVTTDFAGGSLSDGDTEIAVYDATGVTCSDLTTLGTSIGCDQDGGTTVNYSSFLSLTGLTAGNTYYIQVDRYSGTTAGTFGIQVNTALSSSSFDNASFSAYPNPVKDVLNLSYSTDITSIQVVNLLGQEVISRKIGNTSTQLDMSNLTAGAYIVNVTVDDIVKSIKVIKQ
jgi:hypothetical protein